MEEQSRPQRSFDVSRRKTRAAELYVQGWTHLRIGEDLDLSRQRVTELLAEVRREWQEARIANFDEKVDRELAKLDRIESEAWAAWARSQQAAEEEQKEITEGTGSRSKKVRTKKRWQYGDPRFLELVQGCIEKRCRMLGLFMDRGGEAADRPVIPVVTVVVTDRSQIRVPIMKAEFDDMIVAEAPEQPLLGSPEPQDEGTADNGEPPEDGNGEP